MDYKEKIKLIIIYQVIMHYRLPLYERLEEDSCFDSQVFYGKGEKGTKLTNANSRESKFKCSQQKTLRIPFKTNNGTGTIPFSPFLFFSLIASAPEVLLAEGASSIVNSSITFVYAKVFRKKYIWWSLGKLEGRKYSGFRVLLARWERYIALKSDAIFTYSNLGKRHFIEQGVKPEKIFVGVNVLDTDRKLKEINDFIQIEDDIMIDSSNFNIAFIGSITKEKNLITLIESLNELNLVFKNKFRLHIIGDGSYMDELKSFIGAQNSEVVLYGRINEGASRILQKCDLMVLPGLGGLAICEAMLNKLPVITGKADGTEYDLVNKDCGFILSEVTKQNLYEKIEFLFLNPAIKLKMGKESYRRISNELHFDNYYSKLKEAIEHTRKKK
jgi:glycosyltransferase involved in cell wall biosynthesis